MFQDRKKVWSAALSITLFGLTVAGCGGGGGGSKATPQDSSRRAVTDIVKSTRHLGDVLAMEDGDGSSLSSGRATQYALRHARMTRSLDVPEGAEGFDEEEGLYYRLQQTPQGFKIVYHRDAARTQPAGYIELAMPDSRTILFVFRMSGGQEPVYGDLMMKFDDDNASAGRLTGWFLDPRTEERVTIDLRREFNGTGSGSMSIASDAGQINFSDITISAQQRVHAEFTFAGRTGSLLQEADGSGTLTLNGANGAITARYDASGKGSFTMPGGQQIPVTDFDTEI